MGLLDGIAGSLFGGGNAASSPLARSVMDMLGRSGGLSGVVQAFQQNGLGHLVDSWIGTGQNQPVSAAQIQQALGPKVQELAAQHGMSADAVSQAISQLLPGVIDHLTPNGQLPQGGVGEGLAALRSKLGI